MTNIPIYNANTKFFSIWESISEYHDFKKKWLEKPTAGVSKIK